MEDKEKLNEKEINEKITENETNDNMNDEIKEEIKDVKEEASLKDIVQNDYQEKTIVSMNVPVKKIGIAYDHRGYNLSQKLTKYLKQKGYTIVDYGSGNAMSSDYPVSAFALGKGINNNEVEKGIAICGSGIGISIACNKVKGIRCAKVDNVKEMKQSRRDNDANIMAISGKMPLIRAKDIVDVFLKTKFKGEERHQRRIDLLNNYQD